MDNICDYSQISNTISTIRSYKEGFIINFYIDEKLSRSLISQGLLYIEIHEKCIFIFRKNDDFFHLYFISTGLTQLNCGLSKLSGTYPDSIFVTDLIGNNDSVIKICEVFEKNGFTIRRKLRRMVRTTGLDQEQTLDPIVDYAKPEYVKQLQELLIENFDKYSEQIPTEDEILQKIENKQVLITTYQSKLTGCVIFDINGISSHLRYWVTLPAYRNQKIGSSLFRRAFHECRNTKRQTLWVDDKNENAIKIYSYYGFTFESLTDFIMIKK